MKHFVTLFAFCFVTLLSHCSQDEDPVKIQPPTAKKSLPNSNPDDYIMTATVNGHEWTAQADGGTLSAYVSDQNEIVAFDPDRASRITLRLPERPTAPQVYDLESPTTFTKPGAFYTTDPLGNESVYWGSTSGNITINSVDVTQKWVAGTFSFTGTNLGSGKQIIVSNGVFKLAIP